MLRIDFLHNVGLHNAIEYVQYVRTYVYYFNSMYVRILFVIELTPIMVTANVDVKVNPIVIKVSWQV